MSLKVMTIVGMRPELIKLCGTLAKLERHTRLPAKSRDDFDSELAKVFEHNLARFAHSINRWTLG